MSELMKPPSFEVLLKKIISDYERNVSVLGVAVGRKIGDAQTCIGPAAGPHTQLAGNIVAAFVAGADYFEFKTVQVLEGDALGIQKPCIYSGHEVYNSEWSTELTISQARDEYIKAYILNYFLAIEYQLAEPKQIKYIMSVGYDLKGISSTKVDTFIEVMKDGSKDPVFEQYQRILLDHIKMFNNITKEDILLMSTQITSTVALSTMHGCDKSEIERIMTYLMKEKGLDAYIKLNPTLLGYEKIQGIFKRMAYSHLELEKETFKLDMTMDEVKLLIERLMKVSQENKVHFGVKLTNTLPVINKEHHIQGKTIYLSGPVLYPLTFRVAYELSKEFLGRLPISYSGGADEGNVRELAACGFSPITVSSVLLKPGGYKHITKMKNKLKDIDCYERDSQMNEEALEYLFTKCEDQAYHYKATKIYDKAQVYDPLCSACNNCVDTCPNRANEHKIVNGQKVVIHYEDLCNECGNCASFCIKGHIPYLEKYKVTDYEDSEIENIHKSLGGKYAN